MDDIVERLPSVRVDGSERTLVERAATLSGMKLVEYIRFVVVRASREKVREISSAA